MADIIKGKDSLMKRLLSTAPSISVMTSMPSYADYPSNVPSPTSDSSEESSTNLSNFLRQLASQSGCELNVVAIDHAYAKPSNWRSENTYAQPTKSLFVLHVPPPHHSGAKGDADLDIESVPETPLAPYDVAAVNISMSECEEYINSVNPGDRGDDWEEHVNKTGWTNMQQRMFGKMVRTLHADRLARLACSGSWNEQVQRRTIVDRSARRVRHLLACYNWETKITQWLHITLLENLSPTYLAIYLDILQTMRAKAPSLVDRMIGSSTAVNRPGLSGLESLNIILKQPWDPVASSLNELKPRRLPGNPVLLMVPSTPMCSSAQTQRQKQWESYFSSLGMVASVMIKSDPETSKMSLSSCLDQMMCATRVKVAHLRAEYPGRHIILVGCNAGASAACHIALVEPVSAVVCLGFAVNTVEGKRGEPNDTLLDLPSPILFVIGENAATAQREDLEDIRERMRVETGLVVVGSGDDLLRVSNAKKLADGITQSLVDRCILDEVGDFLGSILMHPRPISVRTSSNLTGLMSTEMPNNSIVKVEKRKNIGSEPSSPAAKRSRPGTPLHGSSAPVTSSAPSTPPTSKSLTTLPTLVSVSGTKVVSSEDSIQDVSSANAGSRMRATSGRMLDLSKLTVLTPTSTSAGKNILGTSSGNVVMLAESPRTSRPSSGGGPLLVPVSTVTSPFTLVPLTNKTSRCAGDRSPNQRSYTVIPKITVPSLKLNQSSGQQVSVTGSKLPYSVNPTLLRSSTPVSSSLPQSPEVDTTETDAKEDEDVLSAAKILELPIIFAKDGEDPIFSEDKMGPQSLEPPTVVPISSCGSVEGTSTVTLGDTISFPLEPDLDSEKTNSSSRAVPNVLIIRSKNAKERSQSTSSKRIVQKTQRLIHAVDKTQQNQSNMKSASGIKYTKIILTNRNSLTKDHGEGSNGNGVSVRHDQLQSIEPEDGTGISEDMNIEDIDNPSNL
ncbi:KAT8 regulatory NSL complex subunit 3 [Anabrus simplex]|uniref:KAT8 regulatory NSL complex subunit 3 n=1 Tax=Anabrus simplex TaxID=316456 RepID=UPI0035A3A835